MYVPRRGVLRCISVSPRSLPVLALLALAPLPDRLAAIVSFIVRCGPCVRAVDGIAAARVVGSVIGAVAAAPAGSAAGVAGVVTVTLLSSVSSTSIICAPPCVTIVRGCCPGMITVIVPPGHACRFDAVLASAARSTGAAAKRASRAARLRLSSSPSVATSRTAPAVRHNIGRLVSSPSHPSGNEHDHTGS